MEEMEPMERFLAFLFLLAAIGLCFWGAGRTPLFDTDEPRYAQTAREMMERGDWVLPTFNGQPRYAKPALFYWLLVGAYRLFGVNEFAARFWSGIAAMAIALLLFFAFRNSFGETASLVAAGNWLTAVGTQIFAHAAITDMTLTAFMTGAILAFWVGWQTGRGTFFCLAAIFSAGAVLTKGPIGLVLCALILAAALFLSRSPLPRWTRHQWGWVTLCSLALFLLLALPWYVAINLRTGGEFFRQFLLVENIQRYAEGGKLPLWVHLIYFPLTAFLLAFPWSAWSIWGLGRMRRLTEWQQRWHILWQGWALVPIALFTFSRTKNPQYVLLSTPALVALATIWFVHANERRERWGRRSWLVGALVAAVLFLSLPFVLNTVPDWRMRLGGWERVDWGWSVWVMAGIWGISAVSAFLPRSAFWIVGVGALLAFHAWAFGAFALRLADYRQEPLKHFAQMAARQLAPHDLLVVYRRDLPSVVFYSHRRVLRIDDPKRLETLLRRRERVDVIVHAKALSDLQKVTGWHLVEQRRAYFWLSNRKVKCPSHPTF